mgnify:CR=1 FL=1
MQRISYRLRKIPIIPILITYLIRLLFGCYLPYKLKLGKNFKIGYGGLGVVIHDRVIIGDDCHIDQNVTIGGTSKKYIVPKIGNKVYIGAGAKVIGPIVIGDNVVIGANSVVVKSIPSGSLVVGVPGKIIKSNILKSNYI